MEEEQQQQIAGKIELLRSVMKMSVAINDYDTLEYEKQYFKYDFKRKAKMWMAGFQVFTGNLMRSLVYIDSSLLENVYNAFEDNGIMITAKNQNRVALVMFYVKLKSAMQDLEEIEDRTQIFPAPILYKFTSDVLTQIDKQYPDIKEMTDEQGMSINKLIEHYNDAGKKILHYGEIS